MSVSLIALMISNWHLCCHCKGADVQLRLQLSCRLAKQQALIRVNGYKRGGGHGVSYCLP